MSLIFVRVGIMGRNISNITMNWNSNKTLVMFYHDHDGGFVDHIICAGLVYYAAQMYMRVVVAVHWKDLRYFKSLFNHGDINVRMRPLVVDSYNPMSDIDIFSMTNFEVDILRLGLSNSYVEINPNTTASVYHDIYGLSGNTSYAERFYHEAGVPYDIRWSHFKRTRDEDLEELQLKLAGISDDEPFALVIEDVPSRVYLDASEIPGDMLVVRLQESELLLAGTLLDHSLLLERATVIHATEGPLSRLAEHLSLSAERKVPCGAPIASGTDDRLPKHSACLHHHASLRGSTGASRITASPRRFALAFAAWPPARALPPPPPPPPPPPTRTRPPSARARQHPPPVASARAPPGSPLRHPRQ